MPRECLIIFNALIIPNTSIGYTLSNILRKLISMTKIGKKKLKLSSGKVIKFKSEAARDRFEHVAQAIKHNPKFAKKLAKSKKHK